MLRFFVTDEARRPDGSSLHAHAHDYGTVVLEYAHAEDFFPAADVEAARRTLRAVLHEDFDAAAGEAPGLSPTSRERMEHILDTTPPRSAPELLAEIDRLAPGFAAVSPAAHVARTAVPALVLHGAGDVLIPPSEAEWLARDTPPAVLRGALVTRAIEHVGLEGGRGSGTSWWSCTSWGTCWTRRRRRAGSAVTRSEHGARPALAARADGGSARKNVGG